MKNCKMNMTDEEKAKSLWYHFCTEKRCEGHSNCASCPKSQAHPQLLEMAEWKNQQMLNKTKDEKLSETIEYAERNGFFPTM